MYKTSLLKVTDENTVPFKRCGLISGYCGLVQSVIWGSVALSYVVAYKVQDVQKKFSKESWWSVLYEQFLRQSDTSDSFQLYLVMCAYTAISLVWLCASIWLISSIHMRLSCSYRYSKLAYIFWASVTFIICILDLVTTIWFIILFLRSSVLASSDEITEDNRSAEARRLHQEAIEDIILVVILVLIFLFRGVLIWGFNLVCSAVIFSVRYISHYSKSRRIPSKEVCEKHSVGIQAARLGKSSSAIEKPPIPNPLSVSELKELCSTWSKAQTSREERFLNSVLF